MTYAIGLTLAHRETPYIYESLDSLRASGVDNEIHIFAEPDAPVVGDTRVIRHDNPERLGCFPNWRNGLAHLRATVDADWYLMLQDDVIYRTDFADKLAAAMAQFADAPALGFLSPYCSPAMVSDKEASEAWIPAAFGPGRGFWGGLTFFMPRAAVDALYRCERFLNHDHHRKLDVVVGNSFRSMGMDTYVHTPSLADHIGKVSTLGRHKVKGIAWGRKGFRFQENPNAELS